MDVLFINATEELSLKKEANGTLLLATKLLEAGFAVDILRFGQFASMNRDYNAFIQEITQRILQIQPRCLSFYTLAGDFHIMLRIAREVKAVRPETIVVFGGPQTSGTAEETLRSMAYVDYICTGEGENTVVPFFTAVLRNGCAGLERIPRLYYRKDGVVTHNDIEIPLCDLETLPHWDRRLLLPNTDPKISSPTYFMPIDAGRGCPYNCSFCCTSYFWRRTYRLKTPERILEDIRYYYDNFGIRSFYFSHDAFTINQKLVGEVCDRIAESGLDITWRCTARVDCLPKELILKMKHAGMTQIELGVETASPRMQKLIHKNLNLEKAKQTIAFMLEQGIRVTTFFMYGLPGETEEDLNQTLEMVLSLIDMGVNAVAMSYCKFTPTTEMTETNFDQLVIAPEIKVISEGVFGFEEELQMIRDHKSLFPFYYHLHTKVRDAYQYIDFFVDLYYYFPETVQELRKLYNGDNLRFYRDVVENNPEVFNQGIREIGQSVRKDSLKILLNATRNLDVPYIDQLRGMLRFSYDVRQVFRMGAGGRMIQSYPFHFSDFQKKRPIDQFVPAESHVLLKNCNGHVKFEILGITQ